MRLLAELDENGGPSNAFDCPNAGEFKFPTGVAKFG
jgi:hypothetical protein